jgi:hypothetical protein
MFASKMVSRELTIPFDSAGTTLLSTYDSGANFAIVDLASIATLSKIRRQQESFELKKNALRNKLYRINFSTG